MKKIATFSRSLAVKSLSVLVIGSVTAVIVWFWFISTASAWGKSPGCTWTNFAGWPVDNDLIAGNGDVVTTNKWNALTCHLVVALGLIYWDSISDRKQSVFNFHANASNALWSSVSEIRLPTISGSSTDPKVGGMVGFYDPNGSYSASTMRSGVVSMEDNGGRGGIWLVSLTPNSTTHILTKRDSVRDVNASASTLYGSDLRRHALAWEGVSTTDTSFFDPKCQYRIVAGPGEGWVLYFSAVAGNLLRGQFNTQVNAMNNSDGSVTVQSSSKNIYQVFDANGLVPLGTYGNGTVTHLEKLCLPVYNP
jgi:hypothetical protein